MERMYRATLSMTVPVYHQSGRMLWSPAPDFPASVIELVRAPEECGTLAYRWGNIVVRNKLYPAACLGFRMAVRGLTTRVLVGMAEWNRHCPSEHFENVFEWSATWLDVPPDAPVTALYRPESAL